MRTVRLPLLRGALFIIALAAMAFITARGDNPAAATTYNPAFAVSVSDPNPGAAADIKINFSVDAPDSFPNVKTNSSIQFIPRQWGIHVPETEEEMLARVGGIAGTFNALTGLGIMGSSPCFMQLPVRFTLIDASPYTGYDAATGAYDPEMLTSSLDIGGDVHPGGVGYSGQFASDPATVQSPGDLGLPLRGFNSNEKYWPAGLSFRDISVVYRDVDNSGAITAGDVRLMPRDAYPAGSVVQAGDADTLGTWMQVGLQRFPSWQNYKHVNTDGNAQMDPGENIYQDRNQAWLNTVSYGDVRSFQFGHLPPGSVVADFALPAGVTHYPDFLNQMFPPDVVGEPLARMFGATQVFTTAVSLNIVTYRPGQLPGYPASLGYPNIVILLDPVAPIETFAINQTSDMCAPLSLVSTNLGVSKDNPMSLADESGFVRLTNPKSEKGQGSKPHDFTLVTTSMPDADDDGIENLLDACPFDPNVNDDSRTPDYSVDPDIDGLDAACDPQEQAPPDLGRALVPFQANEKRFPDVYNWGTAGGPTAYRDNDNSGNITPGDDRMTIAASGGGDLAPGVVLDSDADYRNPATGEVIPAFHRGLRRFNADEKHAENVAANGLYDVGEDIYQDDDGSNTVSLFDVRLFYNGEDVKYTDPNPYVHFLETSPLSTAVYNPDQDQDNYGNRADNCPLTPNGVEVLGVRNQRVPGFTFFWGVTGGPIGPSDQIDSDGDDIGDACEGSEYGAQCANDVDDDADGALNDGCPPDPGEVIPAPESGDQCANALDDDGDGWVNDGCPTVGSFFAYEWQCDDAADSDGDGYVNDGCLPVGRSGAPETGDQCLNDTDDDADGLINDGCPAVDPGDVAKSTITGHMHVVTLTQAVTIARHGVKLDDLDGKESVAAGGAATYKVSVENKAGSDYSEVAQVGLRVLGCGTVNGAAGQNTATLSLNPDQTKTASFTVDWAGCADGEYTVQADACHAGDAAPAGLFGVGDCPGTSDGLADTNLMDDAPRSLTVVVGSP